MSKNVFNVPANLYANELPPGYQCTLYVGKMTGRLSPMKSNPNFVEFPFEITDAEDQTEMVLRYCAMIAPAEELARWENANDLVGIVIAWKGEDIFMVEAYNFTRKKWFATGYYPHVQDKTPLGNVAYHTIQRYSQVGIMLGIFSVLACGLGILIIGGVIYASAQKTKQYRVLNPTDYRGVTAKRIADWITANAHQLAGSSNRSLDPSL